MLEASNNQVHPWRSGVVRTVSFLALLVLVTVAIDALF